MRTPLSGGSSLPAPQQRARRRLGEVLIDAGVLDAAQLQKALTLQSDVEYLTREVASLRLALGEVATRDFLRDQLREVADEIVARTASSDGTAAPYDPEARERKAERDRKAERKKRREHRTEEQNAVVTSLGEPFIGDSEAG